MSVTREAYQNGIRVDGASDALNVYLARLRMYRDGVHLDAHVCCALVEGGVCRDGDDPNA